MKDKVEEEDAERAIFLIQSMLQDAGVDVILEKLILVFYKENQEVKSQRCNYSWIF